VRHGIDSKFLHILRFGDCEDYCLAVCDKIEEAVSAETSDFSYQTTQHYASELMEDIYKTWHICCAIRGTATRCS
jgi:hypothetical protein